MLPTNHGATAESSEAAALAVDGEAEPVRGWLDRLGFATSVTCAIHCAAMPLLLGAFPSLGATLLGDERLDWLLFASVLVIGAFSLLPSYLRRHRDPRPLRIFAVGAAVLLSARLVAQPESVVEAALAVCGALVVASGHLLNLRLVRSCAAGCAHHHDHAGHRH